MGAQNTYEPIECEYCGKEFVPHRHLQKYCSRTCSSRAYSAEQREKMKEFTSYKKQMKGPKKPKHVEYPDGMTIAEMNAKARNNNMSYGQLSAIRYAKMHPIERKV